MKIKLLFLLSAATTISCGIFLGENRRSFVYKKGSGEAINFILSENRIPLSEKKSLIVKSTSIYPLKGSDCENTELKNFSNEVWSQITKSDDLTGIKSATIMLEKESVQGTPKYCDFSFSKNDNSEWIQN